MAQIRFQEPTLEEYGLDISLYKSYREQLSDLNEKLANLEREEELLHDHEILSYGIAFVLTVSVLSFSEEFRKDFWGYIVSSIFIAGLLALLLNAIFKTDFLTNILSLGKLNKLIKLSEDINKQIEELKRDTHDKVQAFEKAASEYYQSQLREFFENNLYKKRSGNQQFEEALSDFSSMIEELSTMSSVFVTTSVSYWDLREYKEYLKKRTINHNLQSSKKSEGLKSVRNFVRSFSKPREKEQKKVVAPEKLYRTARKIDNWDEINKKRRITGSKGEEIAVAMEQEFFISINRKDLADKVRHVSVERGDGLGYDILSFFEDGRGKYIEVKSTTTTLNSPYYLSKNELQFLKDHSKDSFIYRFLISGGIPQVKTYSSEEVLEINEITPVQYIVQAK